MDSAPLPPHERNWRHPSELGPTALSVESTSSGRALIFTTGAVAAALVAVMVVSFTPRGSGAPSAVSATTIAAAVPAASVQLVNPGDEATVRIERSNVSRDQAVALVGAPNAISAAPVGDAAELDLATDIPADDARVMVLTQSHTYDVAWGDLHRLDAPDGSIVMTPDGKLLASFFEGELHLLVD